VKANVVSALASQPSRDQRVAARAVTSESASPLGATVIDGGVNFSVFSKHASLVEILLFDRIEVPAVRAYFVIRK
jgi:pullulanase/glycogen debranching enzyme